MGVNQAVASLASLPNRIAGKIALDDTGCWLWTGCLNAEGYGQVHVGSQTDGSSRAALAHRVCYELLVGPIPPDLQCDHLCRVRCCVNPGHIDVVTQQVNTLRGVSPAARCAVATHCLHGHPFDAENTYIRLTGGRQCRACQRRHQSERRRKADGELTP